MKYATYLLIVVVATLMTRHHLHFSSSLATTGAKFAPEDAGDLIDIGEPMTQQEVQDLIDEVQYKVLQDQCDKIAKTTNEIKQLVTEIERRPRHESL